MEETTNENTYYDWMIELICDLTKDDFEKVEGLWKRCYYYVWRGYWKKSETEISDDMIWEIYNNFEMSNFSILHKENTEYVNHNKTKMFMEFCGELRYCSNKMSFDRLFRIQWLFQNTFKVELSLVQIYENKLTEEELFKQEQDYFKNYKLNKCKFCNIKTGRLDLGYCDDCRVKFLTDKLKDGNLL